MREFHGKGEKISRLKKLFTKLVKWGHKCKHVCSGNTRCNWLKAWIPVMLIVIQTTLTQDF